MSMPVDPEIRKLAADPEVLLVIRIIDCFFDSMVEGKEKATAEQMIETCWRLLKRGVFRLYDEEVDDDDAPIKGSLTPAERARPPYRRQVVRCPAAPSPCRRSW